MGVVYLAEQVKPVQRRVAVKVMKQISGRQFLTRFESERQALAIIEHPNVARLYDAGTTGDGRPYFVMEYVPGVPVTEYCDAHHLSWRKRLMLFQKLCEAVHHAHQKGIIHRDLKPSNILVTGDENDPTPKVIDFGVSKALDLDSDGARLFTEFGALVGTPEYMSPEQARAFAADVDTRADIYSLGVVLYELLVGALPFDSKRLRSAGYDEARRVISDEEPPRPCERFRESGEKASAIAAQRATTVEELSRTLRSDLEAIIMHAMEKDRDRRYPSASEFSADIARYLRDDPVEARPPSRASRVYRFVRRHRYGLTAASAVLLALVGGLVSSMILYGRAERQRHLAEWTSYKASLAAARAEIDSFRTREALDLLSQCPPQFRGWEWKYLYAAADTSIASFRVRGTRQGRLGFSADDSLLFVARGQDLHVFDLKSRKLVNSIPGLGPILAMSSDGGRLVTAVDIQSPQVLELSTRTQTTLHGHRAPVVAAAFAGDGSRIATASRDGEIRVWRSSDGRLVRSMQAPAPDLRLGTRGDTLVLNYNGTRVAFAWELEAGVWDVETSRRIARLQHEDCVIQALVMTPRNRLISMCENIRVWDSSDGRLLKTWAAPTSSYSAWRLPQRTTC